jgi:citrate lyase subunit beta / citryl-CoA lyase
MTSTYLFVPGNRPDRFAKAMASGAGQVILDLEDAVSPADKPAARAAIASFLAT